MEGREHGEARVGEISKDREGLELRSEVEMVGGFVEEQQGGLLGERAGEENALAFPAGELVEVSATKVGGVHAGEGLLGRVVVVGRGRT